MQYLFLITTVEIDNDEWCWKIRGFAPANNPDALGLLARTIGPNAEMTYFVSPGTAYDVANTDKPLPGTDMIPYWKFW